MSFEIPDEEYASEEALEAAINSGQKYLPKGRFHATVTKVTEDVTAKTGSEGIEFEFTVVVE